MTRKINSFVDKWYREILGGFLILFLTAWVGLFASNKTNETDIQDLKEGQKEIRETLIGKNAWEMMRDDVKDIKGMMKAFTEKNQADHDSIRAKLGRMNSKLKK